MQVEFVVLGEMPVSVVSTCYVDGCIRWIFDELSE
jgi:hypothetical protein